MSGLQSSGRGGSGNFVSATKSPKILPKDLETPTLKTSVVTTGRGGTGNMAPNKDPAETRLRQDVEPVARRPSTGTTHVGRGGTGNVFKPTPEEAAKAKKEREGGATAVEDGEPAKDAAAAAAAEGRDAKPAKDPKEDQGLAAKGKEWLLGKK